MKIKEKTIQEIKNLDADNLMFIYEIILSIKNRKKLFRSVDVSSAYKRVRELLKDLKGSLSDDIILDREDRV
ncbi:MAG: hypothetical protein ISS28_01945 [Candidatus Cloacimonetes bacterium]|nr:hypothetical protein [Candidatus Cloacimonadota bacterium]MBL7085850.1 hypothetical protein [Candidatus Cloacimonadota bacterium]MEA3475406.1 hypothetical protein [Candidatus Cloacimonadota bacterium]